MLHQQALQGQRLHVKGQAVEPGRLQQRQVRFHVLAQRRHHQHAPLPFFALGILVIEDVVQHRFFEAIGQIGRCFAADRFADGLRVFG
ncbi:MAG: hypothetical protein KatS3mg131_0117 [Candidatus Tectimicrobiota bacterium]|nr:MAG: hypothetical protein KatS3mg131_0117 [Candidatus Tectomicrobia bacterium]